MTGQVEIDKAIYYPMLSSEELNGGVQSREESRETWTIFKTVSPEIKMFLLSDELPNALLEMREKNKLNELEIEAVSVAIRLFKLGQIDEIDIPVLLNEVFRNQEKTTTIFFYLKQYIFPLKVTASKEEEDETENKAPIREGTLRKLQILEALSVYPNLGNQSITESRIRIKSQPEPVRGSLYNWIKYYRDELGIGQHSTVERGQFLFRSENSKSLPIEERERINLILKSIEENYALDIDTEKQIIIFPVMHSEKPSMKTQGVIKEEVKSSDGSQAQIASKTPTAFFAPRPSVQMQNTNLVVEKPKENAFASGKTAINNQFIPEKKILPVSPDVSHEAEKLKREPKPEWIKGAFTKESIPEAVKPVPVQGSMSFSLNHVLPVEQETKKAQESMIQFTDSKTATDDSGQNKENKASSIPAQPKRSQFHIRPVSRGDF